MNVEPASLQGTPFATAGLPVTVPLVQDHRNRLVVRGDAIVLAPQAIIQISVVLLSRVGILAAVQFTATGNALRQDVVPTQKHAIKKEIVILGVGTRG